MSTWPARWPTSVTSLLEVDPELIDFSYSAESYDAMIIMALAAVAAGDDDGAVVGG